MTTNFAVLGSPISHSLSPILHSAAYRSLGLDFDYAAIEVKSGELANFLKGSNFAGLSLTMPLKEEAFSIAEMLDSPSQITRASNTLVHSGSSWSGFNTDVFGISQAISQVDIDSVVIIGSGATARSALAALAGRTGNFTVQILARDAAKGEQLADFGSNLGLACSKVTDSSELLRVSLVISSVPAGAFDDLWREVGSSSIRPIGKLFDVAYNPWPSIAASSWGKSEVISGIEMLKWQAAKQVSIFAEHFGNLFDLDISDIYTTCTKALKTGS